MFFVCLFRGLTTVALMSTAFLVQPANSQPLHRDGGATHFVPASTDRRMDTVQHARGQVLALLQDENGCSAWFREANDDPAGVFQSLQFKIEKEENPYVLREVDSYGGERYKQPWVARAWEWGGRNSTVTINSNGAFFHHVSPVAELGSGGGIIRYSGFRTLTIGPFKGQTSEAQITALLHELGHITARLPLDGDSWDGQSSKNTEEVLRHCKNDIREFAGR